MISIQKVVRIVFLIIIAAAIFGLLYWLVGFLSLPAPFDWVAKGVIAVMAVFVLIGILLDLAGYPIFKVKE